MASESDPQVELRLRAAVESSPSGLLMVDRDGRIVLVNREILRLFGYAREELLGQSVDLLVPARYRARHPTFRAAFHDAPQTRAMGSGRDLYGLRKDGSEVPIEIGLNPIETPDGLYVLSSVVDISARQRAERERHDLEEQLRQAQKMESLGRLAGGVAHDFNNLLGAIIGFAELVQEAVANQPQVRDDIASLLKSAQRGKEVVERILLFSRRNTVQLRPLDLARVVLDAEKLLRVSLPAGVDIRVHLPGPPCPVHADANSLHQVIMNLATNAAQAMPQGGRIDLALDALEAGDSAARTRAGLREMPYARLTLRDTGIGMDADTLSRAFEPFFTTKPPGHGTGLGLSIVHTIVRTHGGTIWLESEPGRGTTATCMLPLREAGVPAEAAEPVVLPAGHGERILLVDDEPLLLEVTTRRLRGAGYDVEAIPDPVRALDIFRGGSGTFELVITDQSMPRLSGLDLATQISRHRPTQKVLLLTGHLDDLSEPILAAAGIARVVRKPVTTPELLTAVRALLPPPGR